MSALLYTSSIWTTVSLRAKRTMCVSCLDLHEKSPGVKLEELKTEEYNIVASRQLPPSESKRVGASSSSRFRFIHTSGKTSTNLRNFLSHLGHHRRIVYSHRLTSLPVPFYDLIVQSAIRSSRRVTRASAVSHVHHLATSPQARCRTALVGTQPDPQAVYSQLLTSPRNMSEQPCHMQRHCLQERKHQGPQRGASSRRYSHVQGQPKLEVQALVRFSLISGLAATDSHRGCVTPEVLHNWQETAQGDMELIDGWDVLPADAQEKVKRALEQGHVDDEDWRGVSCINNHSPCSSG